jgi:pimeloyl-ACP methyl ester carboxylesterase
MLRGFVEAGDGQIHYRTAGKGGPMPLVMIHAAPGASKAITRIIATLGQSRAVFALDAPGMGDSDPLPEGADAGAFADTLLAATRNLGIDRFDLYGILTGAPVAAEMTLRARSKVRRLVLDRMILLGDDARREWLAKYAPAIPLDQYGGQIRFVWNFVRDEFCFFPWYELNAANRMGRTLPNADAIHDKTVEMLKAARTYHIFIRAGLGYPGQQRLPGITVPTLANKEAAALIPGAKVKESRAIPDESFEQAADIAATCAEIAGFLDA